MLRTCRGEADMSASELLQDRAHAGRVDEAIARATGALLALQCPGGFWQGVVQGAANLEAEYVFIHQLLGRQRPEQDRRMAERLLATQQPDGGWSLAPGLPSHLSTTIEAYLALRLAGAGRDGAAADLGAAQHLSPLQLDPRDAGAVRAPHGASPRASRAARSRRP